MLGRVRLFVGVALASGVVVALLANGAGAEAPLRCNVMPFSFGTVPVEVTAVNGKMRVAWQTPVTPATLDCPGMGVLSVDVWEHAYYVTSGSDPTGGVLRGRAQIFIELTSAGGVVLRGSVQGRFDDTDIVHVIRTSNEDGMRLMLEQVGVLDLGDGLMTVDVVDGLIQTPPFPV